MGIARFAGFDTAPSGAAFFFMYLASRRQLHRALRPRGLVRGGVLLLVVLLAGCSAPASDVEAEPTPAAGSEAAANATTDPTPEPTPEPSPSPTAPTPTPTPTPPTPAANATDLDENATDEGEAIFHGSFDYSTGAALLPLQASDTFDVADGYEALVVEVAFTATGPKGPTDVDRTVELVAPGAAVGLAVTNQGGDTSGRMHTTADPGTWTLRYRGNGAMVATIVAKVYVEAPDAE